MTPISDPRTYNECKRYVLSLCTPETGAGATPATATCVQPAPDDAPQEIALSSANSLLSFVRQTLLHSWGPDITKLLPEGVSLESPEATAIFERFLAERDLYPYLPGLPDAARALAASRQYARPDVAVSSVRRFVKLIAADLLESSAAGAERFLSTDWAQLLNTGVDPSEKSRVRCQIRFYLTHLGIIAFQHGVQRPADLPDRATVQGWMQKAGWATERQSKTVAMLHRVRPRVEASKNPAIQLPKYPRKWPTYVRGLIVTPVPNDETRIVETNIVQTATAQTDPATADDADRETSDAPDTEFASLSVRERIARVAPRFDTLLRCWESLKPTLRSTTREQAYGAIDRLLAEAIRAGYGPKLRKLAPIALLDEFVSADRLRLQSNYAIAKDLEAFAAEVTGAAPQRQGVPLLLLLLDRQAELASIQSPMRTRMQGQPFYPLSIRKDAERFWSVLEPVLKETLLATSSGAPCPGQNAIRADDHSHQPRAQCCRRRLPV